MTTKIKKTLTAILTLVTLLMAMSATAFAADTKELDLSAEAVYDRIIALQDTYPTGTVWNSKSSFRTDNGFYNIGYGCAGFASLVNDTVFGDLTARKHYDYDDIRVGDIVRLGNGTHSVVVLSIDGKNITVVEGNYNGKVRWGREISLTTERPTYVITRYPEDNATTATVTVPTPAPQATVTTPAPVATTPAPVKTTPAPATTVKETKTTTTTPAVANGTLVITNNSTADKKEFYLTIDGKHRASKKGLAVATSYTSSDACLKNYGFTVTSSANSTAFTVTYNGKTITVQAGETATIGK